MTNPQNIYGFNIPAGMAGRMIRAAEPMLAAGLFVAAMIAVLAIVAFGPGGM